MDTPAGQHPTPGEMQEHGLDESDVKIWWAFLRVAYPHKQRITGDYSRTWWTYFRAGWLSRGEQ